MKGTIYAYMADQKPSTMTDTLLWATYLSDNVACTCSATGPQNGGGNFDMWAVDDPWWGILSTPVIDRTTNSIYAVDWTNDQQYRVYRLDLTSQPQWGPGAGGRRNSDVHFRAGTRTSALGWLATRAAGRVSESTEGARRTRQTITATG